MTRKLLALSACLGLSLTTMACGEKEDTGEPDDSTVEADADTDADSDTDTDADADADTDTDTDADTDVEVDNDEDGYNSDVDCDDNNKQINPGATEICDGVDNNCDKAIDEGVTNTYYRDEDGDDYGLDDDTSEACAELDGWAAEGGDCDDDDKNINPGASEIDDNDVDENCDGVKGTSGGGSTFDWADMETLFSTKCSSCHWGSASGGVNYKDGYSSVVGTTGNSGNTTISTSGTVTDSYLWTRIDAGEMPKNGSLTSTQKAQFKTWLEEGAPEN